MNTSQRNENLTRAQREQKAYDEDGVWIKSHAWHTHFQHVFESPNTTRYDQFFFETMKRQAHNKRVLEIGCAEGNVAQQVFKFDPAYLKGIDISQESIRAAKQREIPNRMEFVQGDVGEGLDSSFDLIFGRSILHHLDYRSVLRSLYSNSLNDGGVMVFMEPLGSNPFIKLYSVFSNAHTPDEKSFDREDIKWLQSNFKNIGIYPINLLSLPLGMLSTYVFRSANNFMLRLADKVDAWIGEKSRASAPMFRQALIVIRKA